MYPNQFKIIIVTGIILNYLNTLCSRNKQTIDSLHSRFSNNSRILRDTLLIKIHNNIKINKISNLTFRRSVSQKNIATLGHLLL